MVAIIIAIVLSVSALGGGTVYAAQDSLPGEILFPVKIGVEQVRLVLTPNPEGKAHLLITFADERIDEIIALLEIKGVEAKGLDVAQSRLQAQLAQAATIVSDQKAKEQDVSNLAKELIDRLESPKSALAQAFEEKERRLEEEEDELKAQLKVAYQAGDIPLQEEIAADLGQVMAQLELLEHLEEYIEAELEAGEEQFEAKMAAPYKAVKAIADAEEERQEVLAEAAEEGIEIPDEALAEFNNLLAQARDALKAGNLAEVEGYLAAAAEQFAEARRLAKLAEESLELVEDMIEELEEKRETKEEAEEAIEEAKQELQEVRTEALEKGIGIPGEALDEFNYLLLQAKAALDEKNYKEAERLAEQAEEALDEIEEAIEELEEDGEEE